MLRCDRTPNLTTNPFTFTPLQQAINKCGYVITYWMPRKTQKTLSLSVDVVERLEEEDNQSKFVESLLREVYDI